MDREILENLSATQRARLANLLRERPTKDRLLAMIVGYGQPIDASTIVDHARERLPEAMVPSQVVAMEALPELPNGKIDYRRLTLPEAAQAAFAKPAESESLNAIEATVQRAWADVFQFEGIASDDDFFAIGGDSILSIQVVSRLRSAGLDVNVGDFAEDATIANLAAIAKSRGQVKTAPTANEKGNGSRPTPIQQWFLQRELPFPWHWNQSRLLELDSAVTAEMVERAVTHCVEHHDGLRSRFEKRTDAWHVVVSDPDSSSRLEVVQRDGHMDERLEEWHSAFDAGGSLVRFILLEESTGGRQLYVIAHHLVIDNISWGILLGDLDLVCHQVLSQQPIQLPMKTMSCLDWSGQLAEYAEAETATQAAVYWNQFVSHRGEIPRDFSDDSTPTEESSEVVSFVLPGIGFDALATANATYKTRTIDLLLAGLARTLTQWTGRRSIIIDIEGHGREPINDSVDLTRTVGWFTSFFPMLLVLPDEDNSESLIKKTKEQYRALPDNGLAFGALRYMSSNQDLRERLGQLPRGDVLFNFSGRSSSGSGRCFKAVQHDDRFSRAKSNHRSHLLEINMALDEGALSSNWIYCRGAHKPETIERLADAFNNALLNLVRHCTDAESGFTPSDFPESGLNQDELDDFLNDL